MGFIDLFWRHLFYHLFLRDGCIGVAPDGGKDIPSIGPNKVRRWHSAPHLIVPTNTRLGAGMALQRSAKVPFERTNVVAFNPEPTGVHNTDQLLSFRIARSGGWKKFFHRFNVFASIHKVASSFNFAKGGVGKDNPKGKSGLFHFLSCIAVLAGAHAYGSELPRPLQASDFLEFDEGQAKIGQLLFFDPILSGNRNISCATCHNPDLGSADGLSLGIGEGGSGIGKDRIPGFGAMRIRKRIPRNAPALWNLGAREITTMFHDGRVSESDIYENGFNTPAQEWLPDGLNNILAVQALFPMTAQFEMAGDPAENQVAGAAYHRIDAVWPILAKRVRVNPEYAQMFVEEFDDIDNPLDIEIVHIANAIAAFEGLEFQSFDSPFDAHLHGDKDALSDAQLSGMGLFFGKARCSGCHSGSLLTDQKFHALMLPHFGPGRTRQWDTIVRDVGRMAASDRMDDAYRFRTPSLRNVALTAPYGHNGGFSDAGGDGATSS